MPVRHRGGGAKRNYRRIDFRRDKWDVPAKLATIEYDPNRSARIGLLHYASDTPYSRRQSLLSKSLSYFGVDATYACSVAILRRVFAAEIARVGGKA